MSTSQTILVRNLAANSQYFYVFQKKSIFSSTQSSSVIATSLGCQNIGNYAQTGGQITFSLDSQMYAGAVSTMDPTPPLNISILASNTQSISSSSSAYRAISTTGNQSANATTLSLNPLALTTPVHDSQLTDGNFSITTPIYVQQQVPELYCGLAVISSDGQTLLSNYVAAPPNQILTCTPYSIYYVATGYNKIGTAITYNTTNAAECDFSNNASTLTVEYKSDGTFTVQAT